MDEATARIPDPQKAGVPCFGREALSLSLSLSWELPDNGGGELFLKGPKSRGEGVSAKIGTRLGFQCANSAAVKPKRLGVMAAGVPTRGGLGWFLFC
jgi:hypothetical protein